MTNKTILQFNDIKAVKKFFSFSLKNIFSSSIKPQSRYSSGDIISVIRNSISSKEYIETYVRNSIRNNIPSADTVFRKIKGIASESGSHKRTGSENIKKHTVHDGIEQISMLIDETVRMAIEHGAFSNPVNVAIDEHDEPYYGMDNRYLINAPFHKFRGTDRAYRFATLESVKNGERLTLSILKKDQLDGIDNAKEVESLLKHAMEPGIKINIVLMDRGYLDAGAIRTVDSLNLECIIPAKDNKKVMKYKNMEMKYYNGIQFLVINDTVSSGKESVKTNFVHIIYYPDRKRHDFSFYTNINVNEDNAIELAETYRERWGIENGYLEKKDVKEKTHSLDMGVRYFLFFLSVLLYNMWILLNLLRIISGYGWITLMDFIIAMGRGKLNIIMNDNG